MGNAIPVVVVEASIGFAKKGDVTKKDEFIGRHPLIYFTLAT
jgi:hypothetical protein